MRISAPVRFGSLGVRLPRAASGLRIGLLGGSFNPPHEGHLAISRIALARLRLDRVWWLVTPGNPLKSHDALAPLGDRVAACRRLAADTRIVVCDLERGLPTPFTAATLAHLRMRLPGVRFVWLMGADNLAGFHRWRQWRSIFERVPVAVVDRPAAHLPALASRAARAFAAARWPEARSGALPRARPPAWTLLTGPLSPASSTALRQARAARPGS
jgi:nicotinate-nucleotide adenylyltransferase